jgi:hypothetical protein
LRGGERFIGEKGRRDGFGEIWGEIVDGDGEAPRVHHIGRAAPAAASSPVDSSDASLPARGTYREINLFGGVSSTAMRFDVGYSQ